MFTTYQKFWKDCPIRLLYSESVDQRKSNNFKIKLYVSNTLCGITLHLFSVVRNLTCVSRSSVLVFLPRLSWKRSMFLPIFRHLWIVETNNCFSSFLFSCPVMSQLHSSTIICYQSFTFILFTCLTQLHSFSTPYNDNLRPLLCHIHYRFITYTTRVLAPLFTML